MSRDAWNRYGAKGSWFYEVVRPGFKYNLTDIAAALGLVQLRKLEGFQTRRAEIARRYTEAFSQFEELTVPTSRPEVGHAWHLYVLRLDLERLNVTREQFIEEMRERRIGTSVHFIPVHTHPYYRDRYDFQSEDFPVAAAEFRRIVSLPINPRMSDRDVEDVIEAVADVIEKFRR
jgi:dTDP-4-amino-4,6-dideoxygalactose transaminase